MAVAGASLTAALTGQPRLVLIGGEPGIGKTAMAREVARRAQERGARLGWGAGWEGAAAQPYWPWSRALRAVGGADLVNDPAAGTAIAGADPAGLQFRMYESVTDALRTAGPIVLVLDDLQWFDAESVRLLDFASRQPDLGPVLLVGTYRDVDINEDHPLRTVLGNLPSEAVSLRLTGLDVDAVGQLLRREGATAPATAVHRATGGNPFFVRQLIRLGDSGDLRAEVPLAVGVAVDRRVADLAAATAALLKVAAVLGAEFTGALLTAMTAEPAPDVLVPAMRTHLIEAVGPDRFRFTHDLFRQRLYARMPPGDRAGWHLAAAEALAAGPGHDAELAYHYANAPLAVAGDRAVRYGERAARAAVARLAFDTGADLWQQLLDLLNRLDREPSPGQLLEAADAMLAAGRLAEARQMYKRAADDPDPAVRAEAALGLHRVGGSTTVLVGRWPVVELLERAVAALADRPPTALAARTLAALAREVADGPRRQAERAATLARQAVAYARACGDAAAEAFCLFAQHDVIWRPGTAAQRLTVADEMARAAVVGGADDLRFEAQFCRLIALSELGDPRVRQVLREADDLATQLRLPRPRYLVDTRRAALAILAGRYDEADDLITAGAAWGHRIGEPDTDGVDATQRLVMGLARLGAAIAPELTERFGDQWAPPEFQPEQQALLLLAAGDRTAAAATITATAPSFERALFRWRALATAAMSVEIAVAAGAGAHCERWYADLVPYADEFVVIGGFSAVLGPVSLYLGLAARGAGRLDEAVDRLRDAVARAERIGSSPIAARARAELAVTLLQRRARDTAEPRALIAAAEPVATTLGLQPTLAAIDIARASLADDVLRLDRDGMDWLLAYGGRQVRLRDAKGLHDLATLVANPGHEVAATTLLAGGATAPRSGADAMLDEWARTAYRRRIEELDRELARADAGGDAARSARAAAERAEIVAALKGAVGLGGRPRRLGDADEKARTTVTARIKDVVRRIAEVHPELAAHLSQAIKTGRVCVYQPTSPPVRPDLTP
jgi:hypothetical protein